MTSDLLTGLAAVIGFGIIAQWAAWRLKMPSILFLLVFGFIAGPLSGFLDPDHLFGDLLFPVISISVAIILFEGGLSLQFKELREIGSVLRNLITIGAGVTWILVSALAHFILNLNLTISILIGAILVVTGPTVISPLLREIRPRGRVGNIVKWEGILIDPIGAMLAVLVFEAVVAGTVSHASAEVGLGILKTIVLGGGLAILGAFLLLFPLRRRWIPDFLHEEVTIMIVVLTFVVSNHFQHESGLFAVTVMGIILANQKKVNIKHIIEFKENLRILIISSLFILLAARLQLSDLQYLSANSFIFLLLLIVVVRPVSVLLSVIGSKLNWKEILFVSWMAPRGIVAAAIASIFAIELSHKGIPQTEYLVPVIFMVIIGTVTLYGLTAPWVARWLKIGESDPQGVLIAGAHSWARTIANVLLEAGFKVRLVDTNRSNEYAARMEGLETFHGSVLSEHIFDEVDLSGMGRLLAMTSNDEANSLATLHFSEIFDRSEVYQLAPEFLEEADEERFSPLHLRGRFLFGKDISFRYLSRRFNKGGVIKSTKLTEEFGFEQFKKMYVDAVPLFLIAETGKLAVFTSDEDLEPKAGQTVIGLVDEKGGEA